MIRTARRESRQNSAVTLVEDIMARRAYTAKPDQMISTVVCLLLRHTIWGMPGIDGDQQVIGVISERGCISTLMYAVYDRMPPSLVRDVMTPAVT